jgi:putative cardiolipin synthase
LIIDSPELARQTAARFEAMVQPANTYVPALAKGSSRLVWHTEETGLAVEYSQEPASSS